MKRLLTAGLMVMILLFTACSDENTDTVIGPIEEFQSLESPYLVCAGRNPGGVGFDFVYNGQTGGANNLDSLTVSDFHYDLMIRTIKAEKPDGNLGGMPHVVLAANASAVNYSSIDKTCLGVDGYTALKSPTMEEVNWQTDNADFSLEGLETGTTGAPLMDKVKNEYKKLVIGDKWKQTAKNNVQGDELVWLIRTAEGSIVKFIVTDFPASPAPTATGYIAIDWELLN